MVCFEASPLFAKSGRSTPKALKREAHKKRRRGKIKKRAAKLLAA